MLRFKVSNSTFYGDVLYIYIYIYICVCVCVCVCVVFKCVSYLCVSVVFPLSSIYCRDAVTTELCVLIHTLQVVATCTNILVKKLD
jgi:hypothetical protein